MILQLIWVILSIRFRDLRDILGLYIKSNPFFYSRLFIIIININKLPTIVKTLLCVLLISPKLDLPYKILKYTRA